MALSRTTLSVACAATDKQITVTSASAFPGVGVSAASQRVVVDSEVMYTIAGVCQAVSGIIKVRSRGADGTTAVAHDILAPVVTTSTGSDWTSSQPGADTTQPPYRDAIVTVGQNGTIAVPTQNTTILLNKATALSSTTLAAPAADQDGMRVTITSLTAAAHVITATSLLADGASGSPHTTATFAAYKGATLDLVAANQLWSVVGLEGVTIT